MTAPPCIDRSGLSLARAYRPVDRTAQLELLNAHACAACGEPGEAVDAATSTVFELTPVRFEQVIKPCACGFTNTILFLVNDVVRPDDPEVLSTAKSFEVAESRGLLPPRRLEEGLAATAVALHRAVSDEGGLGHALELCRELIREFPAYPQPVFNLACVLFRRGELEDSVAAYDRALELNPGLADAWSGRGLALECLSRHDEASRSFEEYRRLAANSQAILALEDGLFGEVKILDDGTRRRMAFDMQVEGSVFLRPSAGEYAPGCPPGPGPVPESPFAAGWLLATAQSPAGSGLVLGLGCGAGAVLGLSQFDELRLTVVEVDPTVVRLARRFFPLVEHFEEQGRLEIVVQDAAAFLAETVGKFDFAVLDLAAGEEIPPREFTSAAFLGRLAAAAPVLWANVSGRLDEPRLHRLMAAFDAAGRPVEALYTNQPAELWETHTLNWLMTNRRFEPPPAFVPFAGLDTPATKRLRELYGAFLMHRVDRALALSRARHHGLEIKQTEVA